MAAQSRDTDQRHRDVAPDRPEDVNEVAASIFIEQESGTYTRRMHPHNGYYAGDLSVNRPGFSGGSVLPSDGSRSGDGGVVVRSRRIPASWANTD